MSLSPTILVGYDKQGGLQTYNKPAFIPDNAYQKLENSYVFRNRTKKREGLKFVGRLRRNLTAQSLGNTVAGPPNTVTINNIFTTIGITGENPEIVPGTLVITVGAPDNATFTDQGNGTFTVTGAGVAAGSYVNYASGKVVLQFSALIGGAAITANISYYPGLPAMGIRTREIAAINDEQTIFFDTKYAYVFNGATFQEFIAGTTWNGTDSDFFWTTNYRGVNPQDRLFFATNFVNNSSNPIRYTDGVTWTNFSPPVAGTDAVDVSIGSIEGNGASFTGNLPNPPIVSGSVEITVAGITFTDPTGSGTLTGNPVTNSGTINYSTGAITLSFNPTINFSGTITNITTAGNAQVTTTVAHNLTTGAQVEITGFTGTNASEINNKKFTITVTGANTFLLNAPYTGVSAPSGTWALTPESATVFASYSGGTTFLFQARILVPYFGRLLALNIWEGSTVGTAVNIFNRCRFSQIGNPVQSDAWRSDIFGRGGFLDAPTNEQIISATFLNNTLIVFFEETTWQLRYVGEYGLPFIWERIASDLGSESTFSPVLFNEFILAVGDKALISADSNSVNRIDLDIPDQIFRFQNKESGVKRVQGVRDYQKELVYWNYPDSETQATPTGLNKSTIFPNKVLVYNYRNSTWSIFRENVTVFGQMQFEADVVTWDSTDIFWDDPEITWDDPDSQSLFPFIASGNQEGFIHLFNYTLPTEAALSITGITLSSNLVNLTIKNHNLATGDFIYVTDLEFIDSTTFLPVTTDLNTNIYKVTVVDRDTVNLLRYDFQTQSYANFTFTPDLSASIYIGNGKTSLLYNPIIQTKDFNPYQAKGLQAKLSYVDFLFDVEESPPQGTITGATKANPCVITSANHGLKSGQQITIANVVGMTQLNVGQFYKVTVINTNSFSINVNSTNFGTYQSGGQWTLVLADVSVQIFLNSSPSIFGNLLIGNRNLSAFGVTPFYGPESQYQWHRFYATCTGQYFNLLLTYDDSLMNVYQTHQKDLVLNSVVLWTRTGGKVIF